MILRSAFRLVVLASVLWLPACETTPVKEQPSIIVTSSVVCDPPAVKPLALAPVEYTLVDGVEVETKISKRWIALSDESWASLMSNQNAVLESISQLKAVISYYADCIRKSNEKSTQEAAASRPAGETESQEAGEGKGSR